MDPSTVRLICGVIAIAVLGLIMMRRKSKQQE
jgi:hypothetical protein